MGYAIPVLANTEQQLKSRSSGLKSLHAGMSAEDLRSYAESKAFSEARLRNLNVPWPRAT